MNSPRLGRDVVFDYLRDAGVEYVFGVPGTQEIPLIDATTIPENGVDYVPCLHENIAMGAALGYARASGRPGVALVHVTPGAANIIGNLFNAYTSNIPVLVLCGQQHSDLLIQEPLLGSDLVRTAGQYAKWAHEVRDVDEIALVMQRAFKELLTPPFRPVFLSIPWDFLIEEPTLWEPARTTRVAHAVTADPAGVAAAVDTLAKAANPVLLVGDGVGEAGAWPEIEKLANLLGAAVYSEFQASRMNYPNDLPHWQGELLPIQDGIHMQLQGFDTIFLIGVNSHAQISIFRWDKGPIIPAELIQVALHNDPWQIGKNYFAEVGVLGDIKKTLPLIISGIAASKSFDKTSSAARNDKILRLGARRDESFSAESEKLQKAAAPDASIPGHQIPLVLAEIQKTLDKPITVLNEAFSIGSVIQKSIHWDAPDAYFCTSGGSLGFSLPASIGISLAVREQRYIVNIVGDGSALFHPNSWWTVSNLHLPVLYLVVNDAQYKSLMIGLGLIERTYGWKPTNPPWYLSLGEPAQDFAAIAKTYAIDSDVVSDPNKLRKAIERGFKVIAKGKPFVLDIRTDSGTPAAKAPTVDVLLAEKPGVDLDLIEKLREIGPP
ncbi:thiamine pyrophosphate-binding protein [Nocardia bovistercoris]|uniref:acetolactate synthase n=1 Tax=Nocardia bovistercoris TaxID=2785916 RepID=A0A931ID41_9NOCA|nr:thiamine pyrophosphate-binding protein [Nocardia bovistercoris]MBH0777932.1 thiamine pyrophosphate-binding protein [Nocardia bovistercoris]